MGVLALPGVSDLGGVPVGTIVPYVGPVKALPPNWVPCDGRVISNPDSPLNGQSVPRLTDNRFFMSVADENSVLTTGGSAKLPLDGSHTHPFTGTTDADQSTVMVKQKETQNSSVASSPHTHNVRGTVDNSGEHDHGGDKRPPFVGVLFIIRVA